jgi:hypothetical protein
MHCTRKAAAHSWLGARRPPLVHGTAAAAPLLDRRPFMEQPIELRAGHVDATGHRAHHGEVARVVSFLPGGWKGRRTVGEVDPERAPRRAALMAPAGRGPPSAQVA